MSEPLPTVPRDPITIDPNTNDLQFKEGETLTEELSVKVPENAATIPILDVYFLVDSTESMSDVLISIQGQATQILEQLALRGESVAFGVGDYKDFPRNQQNPYAFQHTLSLTTDIDAVKNEISSWVAFGGMDGAEGQLYALDQLAVPPGASIGWREKAKRIIVWLGDAAGHDPVCAAISGLSYDITEASVTDKLKAEGITVIAISTTTGYSGGLDNDPTVDASTYKRRCTIGGTAGQASRITAATGGVHQSGVEPDAVVQAIIDLVKKTVSVIDNVKLVPTGDTTRFVSLIIPEEGHGPLSGEQAHDLTFTVQFKGVEPSTPTEQVFTGTFDVVADGTVVAQKQVKITVPACPEEPKKPEEEKPEEEKPEEEKPEEKEKPEEEKPKKPEGKYIYLVPFTCGTQMEGCCEHGVLRPGTYSTQIIIYNYQTSEVSIDKLVVPVVRCGSALGREPRVARPKGKDQIILPPDTSTMDDGQRFGELLFDGGPVPSPLPLMAGTLKISSSLPVQVSAIYTANDARSGSISIDVEQIDEKR